jgi:hypothetical protein
MPEKFLILMTTSLTSLWTFYSATYLSELRHDLRRISNKIDNLNDTTQNIKINTMSK